MKLATFFEKFDQFAEAPGAVAKMRELVLELSATGRLVPEALTRSVEEDTKLMGTVVDLVMGQAPAGDDCNTEGRGVVFVKVGEFGQLYPREEVWTTKPLKFAKSGDVLVCVVGATVGKLNLAIDCAIGRSVAAIRPSSVLETKFLYYSLIPYTLRLRRNSRGSAQGVIGKVELNAISLWVPSSEVQKRIVAKVDELMALCDRLEAQQQEREARHATLARASLARFAEAPTPANIEFLFHKSYEIGPADLRKSILSLAVQGRLVRQNPKDAPAGAELARCQAQAGREFAGCSDEGFRIEGSEAPFELPESWNWSHLRDWLPDFQNGISSRGDRNGIPVVVLRLADVSCRRINLQSTRSIAIEPQAIGKYELRRGDILITRVNGSADIVGSFIPVEDDIKAIHCDHFIRMRIDESIALPEFVALLGETRLVRDQIQSLFVTTAGQKTVNQGHIGSLVVPLAPLAEQRRIVAKVGQLLALVDESVAHLEASRATAEILLEAVVCELTGSGQRN